MKFVSVGDALRLCRAGTFWLVASMHKTTKRFWQENLSCAKSLDDLNGNEIGFLRVKYKLYDATFPTWPCRGDDDGRMRGGEKQLLAGQSRSRSMPRSKHPAPAHRTAQLRAKRLFEARQCLSRCFGCWTSKCPCAGPVLLPVRF